MSISGRLPGPNRELRHGQRKMRRSQRSGFGVSSTTGRWNQLQACHRIDDRFGSSAAESRLTGAAATADDGRNAPNLPQGAGSRRGAKRGIYPIRNYGNCGDSLLNALNWYPLTTSPTCTLEGSALGALASLKEKSYDERKTSL